MKNYYDKQRDGTMKQIDYLYTTLDTSFRGFRHSAGSGRTGDVTNDNKNAILYEKSKKNNVTRKRSYGWSC